MAKYTRNPGGNLVSHVMRRFPTCDPWHATETGTGSALTRGEPPVICMAHASMQTITSQTAGKGAKAKGSEGSEGFESEHPNAVTNSLGRGALKKVFAFFDAAENLDCRLQPPCNNRFMIQ